MSKKIYDFVAHCIFVKDIKKGSIITEEHVKSIRPGFGIEPKFISEIVGKKVSKNIKYGEATSWDCIVKE